MEGNWILLVVGLVITFSGIGLHVYAMTRFRTAASPGLRPQIKPWRTRREWFSSEHGYRLSRRGAMLISLGGVVALIASFV